MDEEFERARDEVMEASELYMANGVGVHWAFKKGANWAYEWMCNSDHQFAIYRKIQDSKIELQKQAEALAEALNYVYRHPNPIIGIETAEKALKDWRKFNKSN